MDDAITDGRRATDDWLVMAARVVLVVQAIGGLLISVGSLQTWWSWTDAVGVATFPQPLLWFLLALNGLDLSGSERVTGQLPLAIILAVIAGFLIYSALRLRTSSRAAQTIALAIDGPGFVTTAAAAVLLVVFTPSDHLSAGLMAINAALSLTVLSGVRRIPLRS